MSDNTRGLNTAERFNSQRQKIEQSNDLDSPQKIQDEDDHIKITIELGEGLSEDIIVPAGMENCAPELSKQFCQKHGFEEAVVVALTDKIKENIEKIKQERRLKNEGLDSPDRNFVESSRPQTNNNLPHETESPTNEISPVKDIQAAVSYGNLYQ